MSLSTAESPASSKGEFGYGSSGPAKGAPLARALSAAELMEQPRVELEQALSQRSA